MATVPILHTNTPWLIPVICICFQPVAASNQLQPPTNCSLLRHGAILLSAAFSNLTSLYLPCSDILVLLCFLSSIASHCPRLTVNIREVEQLKRDIKQLAAVEKTKSRQSVVNLTHIRGTALSLLFSLFAQGRKKKKTPRPAKPVLVLQLDIPSLAATPVDGRDPRHPRHFMVPLCLPVLLQYNRHSPPPRRCNFSGRPRQ